MFVCVLSLQIGLWHSEEGLSMEKVLPSINVTDTLFNTTLTITTILVRTPALTETHTLTHTRVCQHPSFSLLNSCLNCLWPLCGTQVITISKARFVFSPFFSFFFSALNSLPLGIRGSDASRLFRIECFK